MEAILQRLSQMQVDLQEVKKDTKDNGRRLTDLCISTGKYETRLDAIEEIAREAKKISLEGHVDNCPRREWPHDMAIPGTGRREAVETGRGSINLNVGNNDIRKGGNGGDSVRKPRGDSEAKNYFWIVFGTISAFVAVASFILNIVMLANK